MARNLGFLTAYGLEDIYDFIGEERMKEKIKEFENIPTMGMKLENFVGSYYDFTKGSEKGPIDKMDIFFYSWFSDDIKLAFFLYERSKVFTEENYLKDEPFKSMWEKHIINTDRRINKWTSDSLIPLEDIEEKKINPYWVEYHFLITSIIQPLMKYKRYQDDNKIEALLIEIYDAYIANSERIVQRLKMDKVLWSIGLNNLVFTKMKTFFKWKGEKEKIIQIIEKEKNQGWRI